MYRLIESRLALIQEILEKCNNNPNIELEELVTLFNAGLWIFSPDYESIEYLPPPPNNQTQPPTPLINTQISIYSCEETKKTLVIAFQDGEINLKQRRNLEDHIDQLINQKIISPDHIIEAYILGNTIKCHGIQIGKKYHIHPITYQEILEKTKKRLLKLQNMDK